tara:strand:- start:488 stop:637 length:150 start_codon:yes stop_codon:yes gene_type:complete
MGATKRDYMNYYSYATLEEVIHKYNLDLDEQEEQMIYERLCDISPKDIE